MCFANFLFTLTIYRDPKKMAYRKSPASSPLFPWNQSTILMQELESSFRLCMLTRQISKGNHWKWLCIIGWFLWDSVLPAYEDVCSPVKEMWKCAGIPAEDIIMSEKMLKALFQSGCRKRCFPSLTSGKAESCPRRQALRGCTTKEDDEDDEDIYNKGQSACSERILSSTHMAEVILISDRFSFLIFAIHIVG